ncbi:MAG TPA: sulfatase-like hydrolase/transferase [Thermoguttaceae bacterium]|nr:sulfatase-like hydrolase/transferase [Thermoguttaceae bacterium]HUU98283.1 sulfatase-like hydrolase/transferase [Phycisphaerae bacterium]
MRTQTLPLLTALLPASPAALNAAGAPAKKPKDVLFIVIDDMNDWATLFDPANPIKTPHLKRLAARGAFFTRAYSAVPSCNPSRVAVLTGLLPTSSGIYDNGADFRTALPDAVTLPQYFWASWLCDARRGQGLSPGRQRRHRRLWRRNQSVATPIARPRMLPSLPGLTRLRGICVNWGAKKRGPV